MRRRLRISNRRPAWNRGHKGSEISLQEAADAVGISKQALTKIENGSTRNVPFPLIARLTRMYGLKMDDLTVRGIEDTWRMQNDRRIKLARNLFDDALNDYERDQVLKQIEAYAEDHRLNGTFRQPCVQGEQPNPKKFTWWPDELDSES